jgi:hypothetical protein
MLPEPTLGSKDCAKAGDAMIVARATAAKSLFMCLFPGLFRSA